MKGLRFPGIKLLLQMVSVVALLVGFMEVNAHAQTVPNDVDQDGFDDEQESQGISLWNNSVFPACDPNGPLQSGCVRAGSPDVFLYISGLSGGTLTDLVGPGDIIHNLLLDEVTQETLIGVHQLEDGEMSFDADTFRQISPTILQKAIFIREDLGTQSANTNSNGVWGSSPRQGTPMTPGGGNATVYTKQIADDIRAVYANKNLLPPGGLIDDCTKHVLAHEAGHNMALAAQPDPSLTGSHYSTTEQVVLSQSPTIITKGKSPSVFCPTSYALPDGPGFRLY